MELNHLKYFYVVAKEGGFTRASRVLRVQQPAISKMVRQLESNLGLILLERQKRQVRLTKSGEEAFRICDEIFGKVEDLASFVSREKSGCFGPLRFGVSDSVAAYVVPDVLHGFLKKHPAVYPSIFTGTSTMICEEIRDNRVEFGLFFTVPDDPAFAVAELRPVPFRLVVAANRRNDAEVRKAFIGSREIDYPKTRSFPVLEMLRAQRMRVDIVLSSNNLEVHRKFVLKGLGIALLPEFMVAEDIKKGRLAALYPRKKFSYSLKLVTRKGKILSKNAAEFLKSFDI